MQRRREAEARRVAQEPPPRFAAFPEDLAPQPPLPPPAQEEEWPPADDGWAPPVWQAYEQLPPEDPMPEAEPDMRPQPAGGWVQEVPPRVRNDGPFLFILVVCALALIGMLFFVLRARAPLSAFQQKQEQLARPVFAQGIRVDDIDIGGLTRQQASERLNALNQQRDEGLRLTVDADGRSYTVTGEQIPFARNIDDVLDQAWAIGRQGFGWMIGSDMTPFDIRWEHTRQTRATGAYLNTSTTWRAQDVRQVADWLQQQIQRDPINAVIETFDFGTKAFTVTQDVPGVAIDQQTIYDALTAAMESGQLQGRISLMPDTVLPKVTSVELQNSFIMLGGFTTQTTRDELRNTNIALAARAIDGTTVMPGETFSFNKTVGERTQEKGYQMAPAIAGGVTFDDVGGGVCQVSSTLFNAAALADMDIVDRSPHAWPSSYVDKGLDATVNWPNLDFQFKNSKSTPVFIVARYENRKLLVEVYGMRSGPGESIELTTQLTATNPPPKEAAYQQNTTLAPGTQRELKAARTGYVVDTYRVYLRGGQEYRREKLFTSTYRMIQQVIEYN